MSAGRLQHGLIAACFLGGALAGCDSQGNSSRTAAAFDLSSCDTSFEARASRLGSQGRARLSYACAADVCDATTPFAAGTSASVTIEIPSDMAHALEIESSDPAVLRVTNVRAVVDPCLEQTRAYLSLEARSAGQARLLVFADGVEDELSVEVLAPASVSLRASPIRQFDFGDRSAKEAQALTGEPLLVLPALLSAAGKPLIGLPALTWSVSDESLASVRTEPNDEDESFVRDWADASAVFFDAKKPGLTRIDVRTEGGTQGSLTVRIVAR